MLSLREEKKRIVRALVAAGVEEAEAEREAALIVEHVTGFNNARQILYAAEPLPLDRSEQIDLILKKRSSRMPLQYCLGYQWFMGLKFAVEPGVFIPRTDSETLVVVAEECLARSQRSSQPAPGRLTAGEIGIGSGAIAVSLLRQVPALQIVACDVNPRALATASENACRHGVSERLQLLAGNWTDVMSGSLNGIISNPPYIPMAQKRELQPEVRDYEPEAALFGDGEDGLGFYRALASTGQDYLEDGRGFVAVEVGDGQSELVLALFHASGWNDCRIHLDVNGLARVVSAVR